MAGMDDIDRNDDDDEYDEQIEQMITLRDVERLSDRLARLRSKAAPDDESRHEALRV